MNRKYIYKKRKLQRSLLIFPPTTPQRLKREFGSACEATRYRFYPYCSGLWSHPHIDWKNRKQQQQKNTQQKNTITAKYRHHHGSELRSDLPRGDRLRGLKATNELRVKPMQGNGGNVRTLQRAWSPACVGSDVWSQGCRHRWHWSSHSFSMSVSAFFQ